MLAHLTAFVNEAEAAMVAEQRRMLEEAAFEKGVSDSPFDDDMGLREEIKHPEPEMNAAKQTVV